VLREELVLDPEACLVSGASSVAAGQAAETDQSFVTEQVSAAVSASGFEHLARFALASASVPVSAAD
jgi:hypothetical protein